MKTYKSIKELKQSNIAQGNFQAVNYQGGVKSNPDGKKSDTKGKKSYKIKVVGRNHSCMHSNQFYDHNIKDNPS